MHKKKWDWYGAREMLFTLQCVWAKSTALCALGVRVKDGKDERDKAKERGKEAQKSKETRRSNATQWGQCLISEWRWEWDKNIFVFYWTHQKKKKKKKKTSNLTFIPYLYSRCAFQTGAFVGHWFLIFAHLLAPPSIVTFFFPCPLPNGIPIIIFYSCLLENLNMWLWKTTYEIYLIR
jgi:hypothetical protein